MGHFRQVVSVAVAAITIAVALAWVKPADAAEAPNQVFFDTTKQVLGGPFLSAWFEHGGIRTLGEPVSPAAQVGGRWVQWFQYGRLEYAGESLQDVKSEQLSNAALGRSVAERMGYGRWHSAFRGVSQPSDTATRFFPETSHTLANAFRATWEKDKTSERLGLPISEEFSVGETVYQFFERGALTWHPDFGVGFAALGAIDAAASGQLRLDGTKPEGAQSYSDGIFLGNMNLPGERWIDINLSSYTLTAYAGNTPVLSTPIVDGAPETPTARGTFYVNTKYVTQTMRGRNVDGSEYLTEDVPWVMYFYADFAIHGAYWRSSFGYSGSHGCVNLPVADSAWLYQWADYGTRVEVHD
jgi:hypothetical protein